MWESSFEGALRGTKVCRHAPGSAQGRGGYKMTDDGKKLTNLESNI